MLYGNGTEQKRTFSCKELARVFNCDTSYLYHIMNAAGVHHYTRTNLYTWEEYQKIKQYVEMNKPANADVQESENAEELHPLVTNKKWLKLSCFPSYEEITPECFNQD